MACLPATLTVRDDFKTGCSLRYYRRSLIGSVGLLLLFGQGPARGQQPRAEREASDHAPKIVIRGQDSPELIPEYFAWTAFFEHVARSHQASGLHWLLEREIGLKERDANLFAEVSSATLDCATIAVRELRRHNHARELLLLRFQDGEYDENEFVSQQLQLARKEMRAVKHEVKRLQAALGSGNEEAWELIVDYVLTRERASLLLAHDNLPEDLEYLSMLREFEKE